MTISPYGVLFLLFLFVGWLLVSSAVSRGKEGLPKYRQVDGVYTPFSSVAQRVVSVSAIARRTMDSLPIRILIVEDNPDDEALLFGQLKQAQLDEQIKVFTDGGKALDYLRDVQHKCENLIAVFLDVQLPTLGGIKVLEAIRGMDRIAHLPVILMTSSNDPSDLARCRKLGASSYINKPLTFAAFARAVANNFHVRQVARVMVQVVSPRDG